MNKMMDVRWPAEWEAVDAVWLSWPHRKDFWQGNLEQMHEVFGNVAAAIAPAARVCINAPEEIHATIGRVLASRHIQGDRYTIYPHPTDDVWCRDHGPIFVQNRQTGGLVITDWPFNSWGGKFAPWDSDNRIPELISEALSLPRATSPMILEGGAIEGNGAGVMITTEAVLLNPNRNPQMSRTEIEQELKRMLGVQRIFWLGQGIEGDDTDGHIDDMVRFVREDAVVSITDNDPNSPNYRILAENNERLQDLKTLAGSSVEIIPLPMPEPIRLDEWRLEYLPASYANFLIANNRVIVPVFNQSSMDDRAMGILREAFPGREVVGVDARALVVEGGGIHCISQQQPKPGTAWQA